MYKIALVQNQSEMIHYGFADARPLLESLGYKSKLFTSDNIDRLPLALKNNRYAALILGSNALNDKAIRELVFSDAFQSVFKCWLAKGNGFLCLHQLRLAKLKPYNLSFLPAPLDRVFPSERPKEEAALSGLIACSCTQKMHDLLLYPNALDISKVNAQSVNNKGLSGRYWHCWENANLADWDVILEDDTCQGAEKSLVLSAKNQKQFRVVLSSLPLDFQRQKELFHNIVSFIVEGTHTIAVVNSKKDCEIFSNYLSGTLHSMKVPFVCYKYTEGVDQLYQNIKNGIHTILITGKGIDFKDIEHQIGNTISELCESGLLKHIRIEERDGRQTFSVTGRESIATQWLNRIELIVQQELRKGYIDGSFWSTIESFQLFSKLQCHCTYYTKDLEAVLELANEQEKNGSYDEILGVTCAFLWLRHAVLGVDSPQTQQTLRWVRSKLGGCEARELVQAYLTLIEIGVAEGAEVEALRRVLESVDAKRISEIDFAVYMKAAVALREQALILKLVHGRGDSAFNNSEVDISTIASITASAIDAREILHVGSESSGNINTLLKIIHLGILRI